MTTDRVLFVLILFLLSLPAGALAQESSEPQKDLSPEQQAYQQKIQDVYAQRDGLRLAAQHALDAETAREEAGDCKEVGTTADANRCFSREAEITDRNAIAMKTAVRAVLSLVYPTPPGDPADGPKSGPGGPTYTTKDFVEEFDKTESRWQSYRDALCTASLHQYDGGTGGLTAQKQCELRLTRAHMNGLDAIYFTLLHN